MSTLPCSYEIQPPEPEELRPAIVHPDPQVYAKMAAVARGHTARRFALCRYLENGVQGSSNVLAQYLGWSFPDGVTITDHHGRPLGWYTSIDSAHHHLTDKINTPLWLVWLEPAARNAPSDQAAAATEARREADLFFAGVGFMAAGPADARLHASRLVETAETFLPDVMRQACVIASSAYVLSSVFCAQPGCVKPPQHADDHDIPPTDHPGHQPPVTDPAEWNVTTAEAETIATTRAAAAGVPGTGAGEGAGGDADADAGAAPGADADAGVDADTGASAVPDTSTGASASAGAGAGEGAGEGAGAGAGADTSAGTSLSSSVCAGEREGADTGVATGPAATGATNSQPRNTHVPPQEES